MLKIPCHKENANQNNIKILPHSNLGYHQEHNHNCLQNEENKCAYPVLVTMQINATTLESIWRFHK
jgi:hypothetical protein